MKPEEFKLVRVDWFDAQSGFGSPLSLEELEEVPPVETIKLDSLVNESEVKNE